MSRGCRAAVDVAEQLGFAVKNPVVIQETNHTVVWLRPHAVIAKVGTRRDSADGLLLEHRVASALDRLGAAVAPPLAGVSPVRNPDTGWVVTLWNRLEHDPNAQLMVTRSTNRPFMANRTTPTSCSQPAD